VFKQTQSRHNEHESRTSVSDCMLYVFFVFITSISYCCNLYFVTRKINYQYVCVSLRLFIGWQWRRFINSIALTLLSPQDDDGKSFAVVILWGIMMLKQCNVANNYACKLLSAPTLMEFSDFRILAATLIIPHNTAAYFFSDRCTKYCSSTAVVFYLFT